MLILLSPSKTQTINNKQPHQSRQPALLDKSEIIITFLKTLGKDQLAELMKTSAKLTDQTIKRISNFSVPHPPGKSGAALTTFQGDAFSAITTDSYSDEDFDFADSHLRIISGLYGILRPFDLIQPYRLEMATRLKIEGTNSLYEFWGETITSIINKDLAQLNTNIVINCASQEYSKAILPRKLTGTMVSMTFRQTKDGTTKTIAIYAKRARGMFVDFVIKNKLTEKKQLTGFSTDGYRYLPEHSTKNEFVFVKKMT